MNLNIFIPEISDQTAVDDSILPLLREAISEGEFVYPYYISREQTKKASLVFGYLFAECVRNKTFALALDGDNPVGFEAYLRSPFCDYFQTPNIYDGLLTFVSKPYRRKGVSTQLRKFLLKTGAFKQGDIFRFSVKKDNAGGYLSVEKLAKELTINMVETGTNYEGEVTHQLDI
tara:strand:- start:82 stop:603 length:522 start_codon:yes stop_codon:yes gene_type:complete